MSGGFDEIFTLNKAKNAPGWRSRHSSDTPSIFNEGQRKISQNQPTELTG